MVCYMNELRGDRQFVNIGKDVLKVTFSSPCGHFLGSNNLTWQINF